MKKRAAVFTALGLTVALTAGILTGCGSGPREAKPGDEAAALQQESTQEKEEAPAESAGAQDDSEKGEVVVQIFHHIGEQEGREKLEGICQLLSERNPGVTYEAQGIDYSQYGSMLKTKIAGGDAPDIIFGRPKVYEDLIEAGHIMDISDQPFVKNLSDSTMASMKVGGKVYGIPTNMGCMGVFYNKEVFEQNNVEVPKTHEEMIAAAQTFKDAGIMPFARGFKEGWTAQCDTQSDLYGYCLQQNPEIFVEVQNGEKDFADYPDFKDCMQRNADRLAFEGGDDFGTDVSKARIMLMNGEAAMFIGGNWDIGEFKKNNMDDKIGFFPTPNVSSGEPILGVAPDGSYMIYSKSEHKEEALKFVEFMASEEGAAMWNSNGTDIPCSMEASPDDFSPIVADIMAIIKSGNTYNYEAEPVFTGQYDAVFRSWQEEFAADTDRDVDTYIQKLDAELDAIQ